MQTRSLDGFFQFGQPNTCQEGLRVGDESSKRCEWWGDPLLVCRFLKIAGLPAGWSSPKACIGKLAAASVKAAFGLEAVKPELQVVS